MVGILRIDCPNHSDLHLDLSGAQERTRTSTSIQTLAPEASASTNSATWAGVVNRGGYRRGAGGAAGLSKRKAEMPRGRRGDDAPCPEGAWRYHHPDRDAEGAMSKLVTIFGGSGFVGRYIARRMAKEGWRVRVAVRRPNEAIFVRPYGVVGQVEPVFCNIRDDASVADGDGRGGRGRQLRRRADRGSARTASTRCRRRARADRAAGRPRGSTAWCRSRPSAPMPSDSAYARTKAAGEAAVRRAFPEASSCARRSFSGRRTSSSTASRR